MAINGQQVYLKRYKRSQYCLLQVEGIHNTYIILVLDMDSCDFDLHVFDDLCGKFFQESVFLLFLWFV